MCLANSVDKGKRVKSLSATLMAVIVIHVLLFPFHILHILPYTLYASYNFSFTACNPDIRDQSGVRKNPDKQEGHPLKHKMK